MSTLFALALGRAEAKADDECVVPTEPFVAVTIKPAAVEQDHTLTRAALAAHARSMGTRHGGYDGALGLTDTVIDSEFSLQRATKPDGHGGFCAVVFSAEITLGWRTAERIAAELGNGSCMYDAVAKHEQKHVDIDRKFLATAKVRVENAMRDAIRKPIIAASADQGRTTVYENASKSLDAILDGILAELDQAQQAIDTPEEYAMARKTCGDDAYNRALNR